MSRGLRTILVAAAAFSTVLVGLRTAFADAQVPGISIHPTDGFLLDGSREDDSGAPSEQVEEDDEKEHEGREIHLFVVPAADCRLDTAVHLATLSAQHSLAEGRCRSPRVRGPPAL